jgi:putative ABC transport system permease protein
MIDGMRQDLRYALRSLRAHPGIAAATLLTLALGIGANTALFTVLDAVMLRPLPYPDGDRLVTLWEKRPDGQPNSMTPRDYLDYAAQNTVFERIVATTNCCGVLTLTDSRTPTVLGAQRVSAGFFDILGIKPALGRTFLPGEDTAARDHVVVLSHKTWVTHFGADPAIVGRAIHLNGEAYSVVGVMPADTSFDRIAPMWMPLSFTPANTTRSSHWLISYAGAAVAKLKPGVSLAQARANLNDIAARIAADHPDTNKGWGIIVNRYASEIVGADLRQSLALLLAAVAAVLLIACVNLANLMLTRGIARQREFAVRLALGASTGRLMRQALAEGAVLGLVGAAAGTAVGVASARPLLAFITGLPIGPDIGSRPIPAEARTSLDARVLAYSLVAALGSVFIFAVLPAIRTAWSARVDALSAGSRTTAPAAHTRLQHTLVVAEIAIACVLLVGAGLLLRSLSNMQHADPGFDGTNVTTAFMPYPARRFANGDEFLAFVEAVRSRIESLPGVRSVAVANARPTEGPDIGTSVQIVGRPLLPRAQRPVAGFEIVSPTYFDALGIRVVRGRALSDLDVGSAPRVAVVNETMARMLFPNGDAVHQHVQMGDRPFGDTTATPVDVTYDIVGVVADERVSPFGDKRPHPLIYASLNQKPADDANVLLVRSAAAQAGMGESLRRAVAEVDATQALTSIETVAGLQSDLTASDRFRTMLLGAFAAIALLLAAVGIYGVMSYGVRQRQREMGIRAALGASPASLTRLVVGSGMRLAVFGITIGIVGAVSTTRLLDSFLFGVGAVDAPTMMLVIGALAAIAALGSLIPARRAARLNPSDVLRAD